MTDSTPADADHELLDDLRLFFALVHGLVELRDPTHAVVIHDQNALDHPRGHDSRGPSRASLRGVLSELYRTLGTSRTSSLLESRRLQVDDRLNEPIGLGTVSRSSLRIAHTTRQNTRVEKRDGLRTFFQSSLSGSKERGPHQSRLSYVTRLQRVERRRRAEHVHV